MLVSGEMRATTPRTTIKSRKAASIGAASLKPAINRIEPALTMPLAIIGIVGILPAGKAW